MTRSRSELASCKKAAGGCISLLQEPDVGGSLPAIFPPVGGRGCLSAASPPLEPEDLGTSISFRDYPVTLSNKLPDD